MERVRRVASHAAVSLRIAEEERDERMSDAGDNVVPFPQPAERLRRVDPEVRRALGDLRREIDERFGPSAREAREESFDWIALFDELRHRMGNLGVVERSGEVDEFGLDLLALVRSRALLDFLVDRYWRVELYGADALPAEGPVLFVANRSGLLPWDGLVFAHRLQRELSDWPRVRFLVADWLITLPFAQPWLARLGGVRACRENTDRLLRRGRSVLAFPEGVKGAAKDFRQRYRLQRFGRGGAVRAALECGVPLVPVGIVGAEEIHPILFKSQLAGRATGLPFVPVTPTFPALGPAGLLPLPAKWSIEIGEPLEFGPQDASAANDELYVSRMNEQLRSCVRDLITRGLERRTSAWT
jgi:1-acyl-sn-glycerol-3-phosphate acyltransferase